jgi:hypothetical protein
MESGEVVLSDSSLNCDTQKLKIIEITSQLGKFRISKEKPLTKADEERIVRIVEQLTNKDDLIAFARIARSLDMHNGTTECKESEISPIFERAFWHSIRILASDKSEENQRQLKRLKEEFLIDGGDSYNWKTFVEGFPAP